MTGSGAVLMPVVLKFHRTPGLYPQPVEPGRCWEAAAARKEVQQARAWLSFAWVVNSNPEALKPKQVHLDAFPTQEPKKST